MADQRLLITLLLAGCGGKAAAPTATPVGNEAEPPAGLTGVEPDEHACKAAMRGELVDQPVDHLQIVHPRPGERYGVCLIVTSSAEDQRGDIELSPIVPDGDGWKAAGSSSMGFDLYEDEEGNADGSATLELFELSATEHGVLQTITTNRNGQQHGERHVYVTLLRVLPDGTTEPVLELSSVSSTGEADDVWERALTRRDTVTDGFYDLEVAVSHRSAQWAAGASGYDEEDWTETWTWTGTAYELTESTAD